MTDSAFNADLDALVRGESVNSTDDLTWFAARLYGEEQNVEMPIALKRQLATDLGLNSPQSDSERPRPVSNRTIRSGQPPVRGNRLWIVAFAVAAAAVLALTGVLRFGLPGSDDDGDNQFLLSSPAVPTVSATPPATAVGSDSWLMPVTAEECPQEELIDRGSWVFLQASRAEAYTPVPVDDQPYNRPARADAEAVVTRQRQAMACINSQTDVAFPIESPRRAWLNSAESADQRQDLQADFLQRSMDLSAHAEDDLGLSSDSLTHELSEVAGPVWNPANAVQMADGRVALIPGRATDSIEPIPAFQGHAPVWVLVDDEWLLDEELLFCIGECDAFWQQAGNSTPDASPVMTSDSAAEYDPSWMLPVEAEACTSLDSAEESTPTIEEIDAAPRREYTVVGPANPADAAAANEIARQTQACDDPASLWSTRLTAENTYSGEGFSPITLVLLNQQWEDGQVISEAFMESGAQPTDFMLVAGGDNAMFADVEDGAYVISNPYMALELEDGRIVMPLVEVTVAKAEMSGSRIEDPYIGTALVLIEEDGNWKVDAQLPMCIGDCDQVWSELQSITTDMVYLMPIAGEECALNSYLPDELTGSELAVSHSRQYRACQQSGDASPMQGPEFKVTEGTQPISEEIARLYSESGETAGSLQQVWNASQASDFEVPQDTWVAFQPGSVVVLADGRVAALETTVQSSDVSGSGRTNPVITHALIWTVNGDAWLLDEEVTVCLGNCNMYWSGAEDTPVTSPTALILPKACDASVDFHADFASDSRIAVTIRPGPGMSSGPSVATIQAGSELQYLCEVEETENPDLDRMEDGQRWLKIRTADGTEGWIREVDVQPWGS